MMRQLSAFDVGVVRELLRRGNSIRDVARELSVTSYSVEQLIKEYQITTGRGK